MQRNTHQQDGAADAADQERRHFDEQGVHQVTDDGHVAHDVHVQQRGVTALKQFPNALQSISQRASERARARAMTPNGTASQTNVLKEANRWVAFHHPSTVGGWLAEPRRETEAGRLGGALMSARRPRGEVS